MENNTAETILRLANNGLILEKMTISASELLKDGYIKVDKKSIEQFSPVIRLVESLAFQQWIGATNMKRVEETLKGTYRCILDNKALEKGVLTHVKDSPLYRGLVHGENGIAGQASWEKIDPKEIANTLGKAPAPNIVAIVFQVLAIATSQYYMHEMNCNFETICTELKSIKEQFMIQDASEIIAGHKSISNMVNHFDSIMASDNRRQNESVKAGQIEFDALKQIERSKLKLEKNYPLDPKKDTQEIADNHITGIINTLAQLKMSICVYGMAKGLRVCFDDVDSQDEISDYINEIKEQIDSYKETINKTNEKINDYLTNCKALNNYSKKQIGGLVAFGVLAGPLAPAVVAGLGVGKATEMKEQREMHKSALGAKIKENITLNDLDSLSSSILFLEDYAASLDSKLEIVSRDEELYIRSKVRD